MSRGIFHKACRANGKQAQGTPKDENSRSKTAEARADKGKKQASKKRNSEMAYKTRWPKRQGGNEAERFKKRNGRRAQLIRGLEPR